MESVELGKGSSASRVIEESHQPLSKDVIFDLLQNSRRRGVFRLLAEWDGSGTIGKLAEQIAADENDTTIQELTSKQRKRVYIALHQCHLPKLADCGVATFDKSRGTVELTESADALFPYLELDHNQDHQRTVAQYKSFGSTILHGLRFW